MVESGKYCGPIVLSLGGVGEWRGLLDLRFDMTWLHSLFLKSTCDIKSLERHEGENYVTWVMSCIYVISNHFKINLAVVKIVAIS